MEPPVIVKGQKELYRKIIELKLSGRNNVNYVGIISRLFVKHSCLKT